MSSNKFQAFGISDEILNGIHPKTTVAAEQKWKNTGENNFYGISADILDGIHPRVQTDQKVSVENESKKTFF
jgi:hypothetical protein